MIGANIEVTRTSSDPHQLFGLGNVVWDRGKAYVAIQASGALGANDVVIIDEDGQAVVASVTTSASARGDRAGVVLVDFADNDYGFAQVFGPTEANGLTSCAANVPIHTTATDGHLDDAGTSGAEYVDGLVLTTAVGGGGADAVAAMLVFPTIGATI
ncbi:MAG: hypothetical protein GC149_20360 [Gammaproteobacteria bacterium]|nr:hypothetical protein [Gammaproteobacteria bacterium]